jgi:hypothetical protein
MGSGELDDPQKTQTFVIAAIRTASERYFYFNPETKSPAKTVPD